MTTKLPNIYRTTIGGKEVQIETGRFCESAHGSCLVRCGETIVMVNVTAADKIRDNIDFFPLNVDFEEKLYSVGEIPGGFKRREGRGSDQAILNARLIDRPIRPLFPKNFFYGVNIVATALSIDPDIAPEPLAMLGSSFALMLSGLPFNGPIGAVNVAITDGKFVINANDEERDNSPLNLTVSGTADAILMVEAGAKEVDEETVLSAIVFAHEEIKKQVKFQKEILKERGVAQREYELYTIDKTLENDVRKFANKKMDKVLDTFDRMERQSRQHKLENEAKAHFAEKYPQQEREIKDVLDALLREKVRARIIEKGVRPDGRGLEDIRPIWCEVGILPRVHGTGVFTRGQTQVLTTLTLGNIKDAQRLDGLDGEKFKRYMHQYNMPPYSTGEAKNIRGPGRREIGHGALAERALEPVIPCESEFPYTIRMVSEVLSSNGSSSMASVCGSTLALMDGGVPIKKPVAGIAMGLVQENGKTAFLTDIQGLEDFLGDMDFKVAGTEKGITAIQMDIKTSGISTDILRTALEKAKVGRQKIMAEMLEVIDKPRSEISKYAPKILAFHIDKDDIKDVIGSGGKVINKIIDETGVKIDIEDDGRVFVMSHSLEMASKAKAIIEDIAKNIEVGQIYSGEVVRIMKFGAFVKLTPKIDGMIHISKLANKHVDKVEDVVNIGDKVEVEVLKIDEKGRIDLRLIAKL